MVLEGLGETMLKLRQANSYCSEVQFRNRRGTCTSYEPSEAQSLAGQKKCLLSSPRIAATGSNCAPGVSPKCGDAPGASTAPSPRFRLHPYQHYPGKDLSIFILDRPWNGSRMTPP